MKALFGTLAAALFLVSNAYANPPAAGSANPQGTAQESNSVSTSEKMEDKTVVKADGSKEEKKVEKTETKKKKH